MPLYQYRAQDSQGREVEGALSATSIDLAQTLLVQRGLRIFEVGLRPDEASNVRPRTAPQAPVQREAARAAQSVQAAPQRVNAPQAAPTRTTRTRKGSDKTNTFIFSQLGSYFSAGISPFQALETIALQQPREDYKASLLASAAAAREGQRFSSVLAQYPDLYPSHVTGMVRAGEEGGFLPEAMKSVAEQTDQSRKFKRWTSLFLWWTVIHIFLLFPAWLLNRGLLASWDSLDAGKAGADGAAVLMTEVAHNLMWPVGPALLIVWVGIFAFNRWLNSARMDGFRHRMVLHLPTIGRRAKAEAFSLFAWSLGMVSRAGVAPRTAWKLAVGTMPNLEVRRIMERTGEKMMDGTKLSDALNGTKLVPPEFAPIVQTGEITGDVPGAMQHLTNAAKQDFGYQDKSSKLRLGCWGTLIMLVAMLVVVYLFYGVFYGQLMTKILGD